MEESSPAPAFTTAVPEGKAQRAKEIQVSEYFSWRLELGGPETTAVYWRALKAQDIMLPPDLVNELAIMWHNAGLQGVRIDQPVEELAAAAARYYWSRCEDNLPEDLAAVLTRIWHHFTIAS